MGETPAVHVRGTLLRMDHSRFELVVVAFVRSTGGRVRVLMAVDRDGEQLFDGEPVLLVDHRPGDHHDALVLEGPDGLDPSAVAAVRAAGSAVLVALVEGAFTDDGSFDGTRMLDRPVTLRLPNRAFDM
ncbi:MAG: hypothetical protein JWM86_878 [Thermoleophilia bacterium]|nr:hypothetical protein [Thermoleophilia bacterium]